MPATLPVDVHVVDLPEAKRLLDAVTGVVMRVENVGDIDYQHPAYRELREAAEELAAKGRG